MMRANVSRARNPLSGPSISRRRGTTSSRSSIPFTIILIILVVAMVGMGVMSIFSMLYITTGMAGDSRNIRQVALPKVSPDEARAVLHKLQQDFRARYGSYSQTVLDRGLDEFGSIDVTAARMVQASQAGRPFVMAFSGYSITVGRGNFFNQSFPFEVQRILNEPMQKLLGIPLVVRNAAIGGIPSFPYSFCLEHFVGIDPDVLSWDYGMNEGNGAEGLEAFVRQALQQLPKRPMIIMLDKKASRTKLLKDYTEKGLMADAIAIGRKESVLDDSTLERLKPLPPGFQEWDEFGAPKGCPGRGAWHPKRQEHSMIGWTIAMHFVKVLDRAYEMSQQPDSDIQVSQLLDSPNKHVSFPKPLSTTPPNDADVTELLFGHPSQDASSYVMKDLSCRTSFVPATDTKKTMPSIVVSGFAEADLDIMMDRTEAHYKEGWVLDVSKLERATKVKVERCGGLGYVDMKIAMYGTSDSGKLRLWLPFEGPPHDDHSHSSQDSDAKHWFDDLIICEANEKRDDSACQLDQDMDIVVGGVQISMIRPVAGAAEYLKRKTCVNVGIPLGAQVTRLGQVTTADGRLLSTADKKRLGGNDQHLGVVVDVTAKPKVTLEGGACCLSHIVWETH